MCHLADKFFKGFLKNIPLIRIVICPVIFNELETENANKFAQN